MDEVTFTLTWSKEEGGGGCRSVCQSAAVALLLLTGRREEEGGFRVSAGEETPHRERVEEERARGRPRGGMI